MILFGHFGITIGIVHAINKKFKTDIDLRKAAFFSELPDLLDKPLGLAFPHFWGNRTRLIGHTFIFFILIAFFLRMKKLKHFKILSLALLGHVVLDRIWGRDVDVFLFPFLGVPMPLPEEIFNRWRTSLYLKYNLTGEALGFAVVLYLVLSYGLYRKKNFNAFWNSGVL